MGLQNRVFGWAAAAMVAEQPLLTANIVAGVVIRVGAQTAFLVDDVAVQTDAGNFALFQAKAGMKLGASHDSPLAKALGQAVEQYLKGQLPTAAGTNRGLDPQRDAIVICTDKSAPATVRLHLARALARTGSQPIGTPFGTELTQQESKALDVVLTHARRLWEVTAGATPTDEELRLLLRTLRVNAIDANPGEPDNATAMAVVSTVLPDGADTATAWSVLVDEGQAASVGRDWRDRASIGIALSRHRLYLSPPARHASDIAKLRDISEANRENMAREAALPVSGGIFIRRSVGQVMAEYAGDDSLLIVGAAGAGKSAVAQEFVSARAATQEVEVLRAADLAGVNRVQLDGPLVTVFRAWTGAPGLLLIDGVDALRGAEDREFLSGVVADLHESRWQIVATARIFDARNNYELREAFGGAPLSTEPNYVDGQLADVRHLLIGDLSDEELAEAIVPPLALASLLTAAPPELRALLRNPFNLRLAARLTENLPADQQSDLLAIRSRVGLLDAYWQRRVRNEDTTAREALLSRLSRDMVSRRTLRLVEAEPVVTAADSGAVQAMLSENVLTADVGLLPAARRVLSFSHNILFDYATTLFVLLDPEDPKRLVAVLDGDPSLPLVAGPSFEILVDMLWEYRGAGLFWPMCLTLADSSHVLASLAVAARLLKLIQASDDLAALFPAAGRQDRAGRLWPEQELARQLVGAVRAPTVLADPGASVVPLAVLARRYADNAAGSYVDAALAADLLRALQARAPMQEALAAADNRGHALAALLDGCRTGPKRMEVLADAAARQLPHAIGISAPVRAAVDRLLADDAALRQWGGTVLIWLADCVVPVVTHDADLARRIATTVVTFNETRDEQVELGGSVLLGMNESRRQQAAHGAYRLGQEFARLCSADLRVAAEIFCDLAEIDAGEPPRGDWPLAVGDAVGWLRYGQDLSLTPRDVGEHAANALSAALASTAPADAEPVVATLVTRLHNAAAWNALLTTNDENRLHLAQNLLSALQSGALLVHQQSHATAAGLLTTLARNEPALAGQLEAAVLHAHAVADANGTAQRTKDALIGCLRPDAITSPELLARLQELGPNGTPEAEPAYRMTSWSGPISPLDHLADQGVELETEVVAAARALDEEIRLATSGSDNRTQAERRLLETFEDADAAFSASETLPNELEFLRVRAAEVLAHDQRVVPGTPLGDRILAILVAAVESPDAGSFLG
ncbi:hypothetical protein ACIBL3_39195 [Kribbella sp. NPDC050124]|uniref:hypothetical protein n=1 Tax=Kribbella sp. NPDC050124 TaxID=3364114 RepID=UPI0037AF4513